MRPLSCFVPALAAVLAACTTTAPPTCDGGGDPLLEIGDGGRDDFMAFADGVTLGTTGSPPGVNLQLQTSGLDTTQNVTAVVRIAADGGPTEDNLAALSLQCESAADGTGFGWASVIATIPSSAGAGSSLQIDATITDWRGISATTGLSANIE